MNPNVEERTAESFDYAMLSPEQQRHRLIELATVFFRLGTVAFGGPAAHIAMMDDEVVKRRQWMSHEAMLDLIGVTNLLPGPNSTELAIHIGYERARWRGLFVAGMSFVLPAMALVWLLAAFYVQYQTVPQMTWLLYGIKPVIIAVVLQALWKLGKRAAKDRPTTIVGAAAIAFYFTGINEVLLLLIAGLAVMLVKNWQSKNTTVGAFLIPVSGTLAQTGGATTAAASLGWASVFLFFLKIGCVLYGSGYVLLAFLQRRFGGNTSSG